MEWDEMKLEVIFWNAKLDKNNMRRNSDHKILHKRRSDIFFNIFKLSKNTNYIFNFIEYNLEIVFCG